MANKELLKMLDNIVADLKDKDDKDVLFDFMYNNSDRFKKKWDTFVESSYKDLKLDNNE